MSGTDSITSETVIASKARVREQKVGAEQLQAKVAQGPTSNQVLMAKAKEDGQEILAVSLHKQQSIDTGGHAEELVRDFFTRSVVGTGKHAGKIRLYEMPNGEVVCWHEDGQAARRFMPNNIAGIVPMGSK